MARRKSAPAALNLLSWEVMSVSVSLLRSGGATSSSLRAASCLRQSSRAVSPQPLVEFRRASFL